MGQILFWLNSSMPGQGQGFGPVGIGTIPLSIQECLDFLKRNIVPCTDCEERMLENEGCAELKNSVSKTKKSKVKWYVPDSM